MQFYSAMARLSVRIFTLWAMFVGHLSNGIHFIVFVSVVFEKPNKMWKWTTMRYHKVLMALSLLSFCMVLPFLLVHIIAVLSKFTSLSCILFLYWKGHRVWLSAMNVYDHKFWEAHLIICGSNHWLILFAFLLFYWNLEFIAVHIRIHSFWLRFNIR